MAWVKATEVGDMAQPLIGHISQCNYLKCNIQFPSQCWMGYIAHLKRSLAQWFYVAWYWSKLCSSIRDDSHDM